jgi:hypothetical protein
MIPGGMKRRRFLQGLAVAPAASSLLAQQAAPQAAPAKAGTDSLLHYGISDDAAEAVPHFFSSPQFSALRKLSALLMPSINGAPGALDAQAPEFLDFLLSQSPADRQQLYRSGLDGLNNQSKKRFNKLFADVDASQAGALLAPLREPWTYEIPVDPVAAFLRAAKDDVRRSTLNSREWSLTTAAGRTRGGAAGLYWLPID